MADLSASVATSGAKEFGKLHLPIVGGNVIVGLSSRFFALILTLGVFSTPLANAAPSADIYGALPATSFVRISPDAAPCVIASTDVKIRNIDWVDPSCRKLSCGCRAWSRLALRFALPSLPDQMNFAAALAGLRQHS